MTDLHSERAAREDAYVGEAWAATKDALNGDSATAQQEVMFCSLVRITYRLHEDNRERSQLGYQIKAAWANIPLKWRTAIVASTAFPLVGTFVAELLRTFGLT